MLGVSAIAIAATSSADAGLHMHGSGPQFSQRSIINVGPLSQYSYGFINHVLQGDFCIGFVGSQYATTASTYMQLLDANGWPNASAASGNTFGGGVRMAGPDEFAGTWTLTWTGDGTVKFFGSAATFTETNNTGTTYTKNSNGNWTNVTGQTAKIIFNWSGVSGPQLMNLQIIATGGTDGFLTGLKLYRSADETDLLAGNVFRAPFKQSLVNLNPSALRFMDMLGTNADANCRFENRSLPSLAGYGVRSNWVASPAYGNATFSTPNQYTLAAVSTGARQTTASMLHGEIATCRMETAAVRGVAVPITAGVGTSGITNAANGVVTTDAAHGYLTGDIIIHQMAAGVMPKLNYLPCTITVLTSTTYQTNVNTTTFGAFSGAANANQYATLQVGSGNDRTAYPIIFMDGSTPALNFGSNYISLHDYKTFYFDKTLAAKTDGAGNWVHGVWIFNDFGNAGGHSGDVPIEICTALVNEVNAMSVIQGINNPVHMWMNLPHWALTASDPDYTTQSDWPINAVTTVLSGANGFAGLTARANLFLEYSNETWNTGGGAFSQTPYLARRGFLRWPTSGTTDFASMVSLRSTLIMRSIKAAFGGNSRLKYILGGFVNGGVSPGVMNDLRINGSTFYTTDVLNVWGTAPMANHDLFAVAPYVDNPASYYTGQFVTDSAGYAGGGAGQAAAIASFLATLSTDVALANPQSFNYFATNNIPAFVTAVVAANAAAKVCHYEGAADTPTLVGASLQGVHTITSADSAFLLAVVDSAAYGAALTGFFSRLAGQLGCVMPAPYKIYGGDTLTPTDQRWSYCHIDSYVGTTEGQQLLNNGAWAAMSARNQAVY